MEGRPPSRIAVMKQEYRDCLGQLFRELEGRYGDKIPSSGPEREAISRSVVARISQFSNVVWHNPQINLISTNPGELAILADAGLPIVKQQCLDKLVLELLNLWCRFASEPGFGAWGNYTSRQIAIVVGNYLNLADRPHRPPGSEKLVALLRCLAKVFDCAPIWDWDCAGDARLAALADALAVVMPTANLMNKHVTMHCEPGRFSRSVQVFLRDFNAVRTGASVAGIRCACSSIYSV